MSGDGIVEDIATDAVSIEKMVLPSASATIASVAGVAITAGQLETATGSVQAFATALIAAIKAKNYATVAELTADEVLTVLKDMGIGGPEIAIASLLLPVLFDAINSGKLTFGTLSDNAGETQEQDVQSSVGL